MKTFIIIIAGIIVFTGFILAIEGGLTKSAQNECMKWNREAKVYEGYYYTPLQIEQCEAEGIPLEPIKCYTAEDLWKK